MAKAFEVNFDGLVGPTHNYSGLSVGNIASTSHKALESNPLEAVLQGLEKMKTLADEGFQQGIIPPHERPDIQSLREFGFTGSDKKILQDAGEKAPALLSAVASASCMWTANAATVSPSADSKDKKIHFTPANLVAKLHRAIEHETTSRILQKTFKNPKHFVHHAAIPGGPGMGDEGAANHTRLCTSYDKKGVQFFVYGRHGIVAGKPEPKKFPARQTLESSQALARLHLLDPKAVVYAQQNPDAIDAGVFHNDVAGVGNQNVYFYHELAYLDSKEAMSELKNKFQDVCKADLHLIEVPASEVSLTEAVKSYLFNTQLLTRADGQMMLIAPSECEETPSVARYLEKLLRSGGPIKQVRFFNLRQSMQNGGGPACLRLRVVMSEKELAACNQKSLISNKNYPVLVKWARKHYRDRLNIGDLADPSLLRESRTALDELTQILGLGSIYPFQKTP